MSDDDGTVDVLVIGAGPSGCAAGVVLARAGLRVRVIDRASFPRPKVCGDALSNRAIAIIGALGAGDALAAAPHADVLGALALLPDGSSIPRDYGAARGMIVGRLDLDALLVRALVAAGAELREGVAADDLVVEGGAVVGARVGATVMRARAVLAADGPGSVATRALGVAKPRGRGLAISATAYYEGVTGALREGWSEHWFDPSLPYGYGWIFPAVEGVANVGVYLRRDGYDAFARPAAAYSTGGWFPDPVVSPMLGDGHGAFADLANVILHESVHASVLVPDQPFFNESFAEYVADRLTDRWVVERFGAGSDEEVAWLFGQAVRRARTSRMVATYRALDALYQRKGPAAATLAAKAAIIDRVVAELRLVQRPNNASLIEMQVYQAGGEVHAQAHAACGDLRTLVRAAATLRRGDFARRLEQDLAPIGAELTRRCQQLRTATAATAPPTQKNEQL